MEINLPIVLLAGMLAAFNPCGFAMLPAYLGALILGQSENAAQNYRRAVYFSVGMATGLIAVFAGFALLIAPFTSAVEAYLPYITLAMASILAVTGVALLWGKSFALTGLFRPSLAPTTRFLSQVGYGVTYALASLSCTIGPFLAATTLALRSGSFWNVLATFVTYGAGMAVVVFLLALLTASSHQNVISAMRRNATIIEKIMGALLVLIAVYLATYGIFELQLLNDATTTNPIISAASAVQGTLARALFTVGAGWVVAATLLVGVVVYVTPKIAARRTN